MYKALRSTDIVEINVVDVCSMTLRLLNSMLPNDKKIENHRVSMMPKIYDFLAIRKHITNSAYQTVCCVDDLMRLTYRLGIAMGFEIELDRMNSMTDIHWYSRRFRVVEEEDDELKSIDIDR